MAKDTPSSEFGGGLFAGLGGFNLPGFTGGAAGPAVSGGDLRFSDRNLINVAPVGVNLGEILRNFEGPAENGGFGLETRSRYINGSRASGGVAVQAGFGGAGLLLIVAAGAAAVFFFAR